MRGVIIAGGGLAGLSLGIALRRHGVPVEVREAGSYPRHRVCGEFISGITHEELDALGISGVFDSAPQHRSTAWYDETGLLIQRSLPEPAHGMSRYSLDEALAGRFRSLGGRLTTGQRHSQEGEGVVWACGRMKGTSPWVGLKAHFKGLALSADLEVHLSRTAYVGLTRVENGLVNVSGLFRRNRPVMKDEKSSPLHTAIRETGMHQLADRLQQAEMNATSLKGVNQLALGWQARKPGAVCIGDAAAMIPPFTGNGMTMAFQSAITAIEPLREWSGGNRTWDDTAKRIAMAQRLRFSQRLRWANLLQTMLMHPVGRRLVATLLGHDLLPFEWLYHKLR